MSGNTSNIMTKTRGSGVPDSTFVIAISMFTMSAIYFIRRIHEIKKMKDEEQMYGSSTGPAASSRNHHRGYYGRHHRQQRSFRLQGRYNNNNNNKNNKDDEKDDKNKNGKIGDAGDGGLVSSRGKKALAPAIPYLKQFLECLSNPCDLLSNPTGNIALCVAENKLVLDLLADRFMSQPGTSTAAFSNSDVYCYNSFLGMPIAREAVAYFLARHFLFPMANDDINISTIGRNTTTGASTVTTTTTTASSSTTSTSTTGEPTIGSNGNKTTTSSSSSRRTSYSNKTEDHQRLRRRRQKELHRRLCRLQRGEEEPYYSNGYHNGDDFSNNHHPLSSNRNNRRLDRVGEENGDDGDNEDDDDDEDFVLTPQIALQHIKPSNVALAAGAAALLNHLFFLLGESSASNSQTQQQQRAAAAAAAARGRANRDNDDDDDEDEDDHLELPYRAVVEHHQEPDCCLIPVPYYAAFENDMNLIANIIPVGIQQSNPVVGPTENELNITYLQCKSKGLHPRFILITNPNNPLGIMYKPSTIRMIVTWARKKQIHVIVDEVYALSTHRQYNHGFYSIIEILDNQLHDDVHMIWAISKDFGCSGLRVGVVYTQNETLLESLATISMFTGVSGPIQYLVSEMLTDDIYVDNFLQQSRLRLLSCYHICTNKLDEMCIPYIRAEAGMFIYIDFTSLLPKTTRKKKNSREKKNKLKGNNSKDDNENVDNDDDDEYFIYERRLCNIMFRYARIVLTPGESQRDTTPGMFRICYAWNTPEVLEVAMERLSRLVSKLRRIDDWWSTSNNQNDDLDRIMNNILVM